ncbi:MAG: hypothetical protein RIR11_2127 [Bacteroidota bacterium]|jgi:hypothetical protein
MLQFVLLFVPRFPEFARHSKLLWIAILVLVVVILIYHNIKLKYRTSGHFQEEIIPAFDKKVSRNSPIRYSSNGRSGHVHYQSAETEFALYYEFGGGDCVVCIDIPSPQNWEKITKIPLARRDEILSFIGQQVVQDQTTNGRGSFKIEGDWLNIYA